MSVRPEIALIVARARNGVIGRNNTLPWRLRDDLQQFKARTLGSPIIMGRKTWESLGRPLPGRRNLVISRQAHYVANGAQVFASLDAALAACAETERVFVIGGAQIYAEALPRADVLWVTEVDADVEGDAYFAAPDPARFEALGSQRWPSSADNEYAFSIVEYRPRQAR